MKIFSVITLVFLFSITSYAQKFMTRTGFISFFSQTALEDIEAENNQVASILDASNGEIVFQVLMRSFHFDKALMEEHFNENYVESDKYPKSTFTGRVEDISQVNFDTPGEYNVEVNGQLTIHGVTREVSEKGIIRVNEDGGVMAQATFSVKPEDYNIEIPSVVRDKIAKNVDVTVDINYPSAE